MQISLGKLFQVAGAAAGTYFCPGVGTAVGSMVGKTVGNVFDGKGSVRNNQTSSNNASGFDIGNVLAGLSNFPGSENTLDISKKILLS